MIGKIQVTSEPAASFDPTLESPDFFKPGDDPMAYKTVKFVAMASNTIKVSGCARCGADHEALDVAKLDNAGDEFTHYALCPQTGQPVLVKFDSIETARPKQNGQRTMYIDRDLVLSIATGFKPGERPRFFQVVDPIPRDAAVVTVEPWDEGKSIRVILESAEWKHEGLGDVTPRIASVEFEDAMKTAFGSFSDRVEVGLLFAKIQPHVDKLLGEAKARYELHGGLDAGREWKELHDIASQVKDRAMNPIKG